jgi:hypothetical protein
MLLRAIPLRSSHAWDETVFLQHAMVMLDGRSNYDEFHHRPPALSALYAIGFAIRDHLHTAHLVQGLASGLAVLFGFLFAQRAFGRQAALAAAGGRDRNVARAAAKGPVAIPSVSRWASVRLPAFPRFHMPPMSSRTVGFPESGWRP